jgi:integrase
VSRQRYVIRVARLGFTSPKMHGVQPYWPENLLRRHMRPAAKRAGTTKLVGWHSFRRTFATLLKGSGEDVKTTQELMRHASSRITMDVYAQALTPAKRSAQRKLAELIKPVQSEAQV